MSIAPEESPKMLLTYRFRLYPTKEQHGQLADILEQQRQLYNAALQERISAFEKGFFPDEVPGKVNYYKNALKKKADSALKKGLEGIPGDASENERRAAHLKHTAEHERAISAIPAAVEAYRKVRQHTITAEDQGRSLTIVRGDDPAFSEVQRRIQAETLSRLDRAYDAFFRRVKAGFEAPGFPRFKGREFFDGFGFNAFLQVKLENQRFRFSGIAGGLRTKLRRPIDGAIKNIWFKREKRSWFCGLQVEVKVATQRQKGAAIGVDWGTSALAVLSSGEVIANIRAREKLASKLLVAERKVARAKKGSRKRLQARAHKKAIERKIANRRKNYLDKVSNLLTKRYRLVAIEDIEVKKMKEKHDPSVPKNVDRRRNRELSDVAPGMFLQMLTYKGIRNGADVRKVDPAYKTQTCSSCGCVSEHKLADMWHLCPDCGVSMPRKKNAALGILKCALDDMAGPGRGGAKLNNSSVCPGNTGAGKPATGRRGVETPFHPSCGKAEKRRATSG